MQSKVKFIVEVYLIVFLSGFSFASSSEKDTKEKEVKTVAKFRETIHDIISREHDYFLSDFVKKRLLSHLKMAVYIGDPPSMAGLPEKDYAWNLVKNKGEITGTDHMTLGEGDNERDIDISITYQETTGKLVRLSILVDASPHKIITNAK